MRLVELTEAIDPDNPPPWTYRLTCERLRQEKAYVCTAHCTSSANLPVDIVIHMGDNYLGWVIDVGASRDAVAELQKRYNGRTGLLHPVSDAVHEALGLYLAEQKPTLIIIRGSDQKREHLYRDGWGQWRFPNYGVEIIRGGVAFVRADQGPDAAKRATGEVIQARLRRPAKPV